MSNIVVPVSFYRTSQHDFFLNDNIPNNAFILNSSNNGMYMKAENKIYSITLNNEPVATGWKNIVAYANIATNPPEWLPIGYTKEIKFKSSGGVLQSAKAVLVDYNKDSYNSTKAKFTFVVFTNVTSGFSTSTGGKGRYINSDILKPLIDGITLHDEQGDIITTKTVSKYTNHGGYYLNTALFPLDKSEIVTKTSRYEYFKSTSFPEEFIGKYWLRTDDNISPIFPYMCSVFSNNITCESTYGVGSSWRVCFGFCL